MAANRKLDRFSALSENTDALKEDLRPRIGEQKDFAGGEVFLKLESFAGLEMGLKTPLDVFFSIDAAEVMRAFRESKSVNGMLAKTLFLVKERASVAENAQEELGRCLRDSNNRDARFGGGGQSRRIAGR